MSSHAPRRRTVIDTLAPSNTADPVRTIRLTAYPTAPDLLMLGIGDGDPLEKARACAVLNRDQADRIADVLQRFVWGDPADRTALRELRVTVARALAQLDDDGRLDAAAADR